MRSSTNLAVAALVAANPTFAQWGGQNFGPSCLSQCWTSYGTQNFNSNWGTQVCSNSSGIDSINSCVASSSCSDSDKQGTYQFFAQICANAGHPLTQSPEAVFSATSGGNAYSTGAWASWASANQFPTITSGPGSSPTNGPGGHGWGPGQGWGPFGPGASANGWGPWGGSTTGSWTAGPWTQWWNGSSCPPATWTGWTAGSWASNCPWTTWAACTSSTTGTTTVTTTTTGSNGAPQTVTTTMPQIQVAEATASGTSTSASHGAAPRQTMAIGAGLGGLVAAVAFM
ncbi:hypothetical protein K461DRAFT_296091 [Myriangium duriaei CBS 260.36]|uniref:Extracellular membrane protein CFEM domain-containing protein n=1 Tax=Myriangium duriaei CBS 260.36 TaxID=1168546 RepID=A0A9P4J1T9_9PEZI|nr:hypothetical protein K461DRAFT_296091 [Myriangium duriaei CBS 260.36]